MSRISATYNERSWAIDLIGYIKNLATQNNRSIKDAGGEQTIRSEGGSLFPDVLLFGDRATARILQGWELKMPDTSIDDFGFKSNAEAKARALGLDSFLLWNVSHAHLYIHDSVSDQFVRAKEWRDLADITTRTAVVSNRQRWQALASDILGYLNDLFDRGSLEGRQFIEAYRSGGVTALIMENAGEVTEAVESAALIDARFRAEMVLWWDLYGPEYGTNSREQVLGQAIISNWIGKILFAHILREKDQRAQRISSIGDNTTPEQALELFRRLSEDCNFWTIFSDSLGLKEIPERTWDQLKQFNRLLTDLRVGSVDQTQLSGVLEATVEVAIRKLRGQYPTPIELARLLAHICMRNIVADKILDPCCGSGTIARAALEQKLSAGVPPDQASSTIYASDQDPQAIQIATFALAKPSLMHMPLRIFQRDAFSLSPELNIDFRNPSDGTVLSEQLGVFQAITSNLPFVAQAGRKRYEGALRAVLSTMQAGRDFTGRADVAAYLPFSLHPLLADGGRLGIIITNAWLGTDWGNDFYLRLASYYDLKCVITSGAGRWFKNSKVVTNILIMDKKSSIEQVSGDVKFIVLTRPLEEMSDSETIQIAAAQIEMGQTQNDTMTIRLVSQENMAAFRPLGLGGNAQFVNCDWILDMPLIPLKSIFDISRGERRGMNDLFYPKPGHGIEAEYIKPLAKSPAEFTRLSMPATKVAFSCSRTEEELETLGHTGALNWIRRFKTQENIDKLSRADKLWYQMDTDSLTDLVMFINYGDRLFVGRVNPPTFVDQRLVPLRPLLAIDIDLHHALLNSAISMFIIEGMGFGRGLGALDLNKDRIEEYMHMLDANRLDNAKASRIKATFLPLTQREILPIADELVQADRIAFDDVIIEAFGLDVSRRAIYESVLFLVKIRQTATE
ncbi:MULTISPECIES: N-6 DNA methylase [unclassified Chitinophaga]|uniref:N-6 DNA methylase n=1 Tax=unclassified Chitinophaga TaxID=2619133 RepID=UPI00301028B9